MVFPLFGSRKKLKKMLDIELNEPYEKQLDRAFFFESYQNLEKICRIIDDSFKNEISISGDEAYYSAVPFGNTAGNVKIDRTYRNFANGYIDLVNGGSHKISVVDLLVAGSMGGTAGLKIGHGGAVFYGVTLGLLLETYNKVAGIGIKTYEAAMNTFVGLTGAEMIGDEDSALRIGAEVLAITGGIGISYLNRTSTEDRIHKGKKNLLSKAHKKITTLEEKARKKDRWYFKEVPLVEA